MVLSFDQHQGLAVLPQNGRKRDGSVTGLTGAQELSAHRSFRAGRQVQLAEHAPGLKVADEDAFPRVNSEHSRT